MVQNFITSQGDGKSVKEYAANIPVNKKTDDERGDQAEEFLLAFNSRFKGID